MKTQAKNELKFKKVDVTELNETKLTSIKGGSGTGFNDEEIPPLSRFTSVLCTGIVK